MKRIILAIFLLFVLFSCKTIPESTPTDITDNILPVPPVQKTEEIIEPETKENKVEKEIDSLINNMTLKEKVGQLFMLEIRTGKNGNNLYEIDETTIKILKDFNPGGIILFANNVKNTEQVNKLITDLQNNTKTPLFIAVDEEGGVVSRLGKNKNVLVTHLPPALTIGNKGDEELTYKTGLLLARELRAIGVNMNMAPIADVNTNPKNPVIGNRTYSPDPQIAGKMVSQIIRAYNNYNLIGVLKHFPGHGDTSEDTHLGSVISPHNIERLEKIEFVPFYMGIEAGADAIMTAHMLMQGISTKPYPATLNKDIITGIIRDKMNFKGVIITDAMDMGAISNNFDSGTAARLAIMAGADIILIPENPTEAYYSILFEVENGTIPLERIDESVKRILLLKNKRGILDNANPGESSNEVFNDLEHKKLINEIFNQQKP